MKEETRYRVTGSLFLLALAIIVLPMILDGEGLPTVEPAPIVVSAQVDLEQPPLEPDPELEAATDRLLSEVSPDGFAEATGTRLGEPVLSEPDANAMSSEPLPVEAKAAAPTVSQPATAAVSASEPPANPQPSAAGQGEPKLAEANRPTGVWAIQVASFANVDNARVLRDRLRADGYEAFLSSLQTDAGISTRVAVGPVQNRDEAQALKQALSERYRVTARLMAFSI